MYYACMWLLRLMDGCTSHLVGMPGSSVSIEHDNYPVPVGTGKVEVCAAYYGTQPLASDTTVQLRTLENPMFPGPSQGKCLPLLPTKYRNTYLYVLPIHMQVELL